MSDESTTSKGRKVLRDGRLKATLWPNEGEHGPYVSIDLSHTYTDKDGNPRDSKSVSVSDALKASELLRQAYPVGRSMEKEMRRERQADRSRSRQNQEPQR